MYFGTIFIVIVDPAMADNGSLYPGFDDAFVQAMKGLCGKADYVMPNITEACFLTGLEYKTEYDCAYIDELLAALTALGCKNIILTGVSYASGKTGVVVYENGSYAYYEHEKLPNSSRYRRHHFFGDIFLILMKRILLIGYLNLTLLGRCDRIL